MKIRLLLICCCGLLLWTGEAVSGGATKPVFDVGVEAYNSNDFPRAAQAFRAASESQLSVGAFQNLGKAEWQIGRIGLAVLAWERALWLDPYDPGARNDLQFARAAAQLEAPYLTWYEIVSTWLPTNYWAWIVGGSLCLAVGMMILPGVLRLRKTSWHQTVTALALVIFLLSIPAHFGVVSRTSIGFVLVQDAPLRLTPTAEAEPVTTLAAGEPAHLDRVKGKYLFIRTRRATGWVERGQFDLVAR